MTLTVGLIYFQQYQWLKVPFVFTEPIHKFNKVLKDSQAEETCSVTLQCETAQTPSTVIWLKGHTELKPGGRYEMSQKEGVLTLTIKELEEKDTDIYTCDVGTAKSTAKLMVNGKKLLMDRCVQTSLGKVSSCRADYFCALCLKNSGLLLFLYILLFSDTGRGTVYGTFLFPSNPLLSDSACLCFASSQTVCLDSAV